MFFFLVALTKKHTQLTEGFLLIYSLKRGTVYDGRVSIEEEPEAAGYIESVVRMSVTDRK